MSHTCNGKSRVCSTPFESAPATTCSSDNHKDVDMHVCICLCMHICIYVYLYINVYKYTCIHVYMCIYKHECVHTHPTTHKEKTRKMSTRTTGEIEKGGGEGDTVENKDDQNAAHPHTRVRHSHSPRNSHTTRHHLPPPALHEAVALRLFRVHACNTATAFEPEP